MKKRVYLILIIILNTFLVSCGRQDDISFEKVSNAVFLENLNQLEAADSKTLRRFIGLNINEIEAFSYRISDSSMEVEEVLLVKVKDKVQFDEIELLIESRITSQLNRFEGYKPENCLLLNEYELKIQGDYLLFVVSESAEDYIDRFTDVFRK